jgi:hypothetical protein
VAHVCNPSYSGGRDQEDRGSKPDQANSSARPYLEKNPLQKRAGEVIQGVGPEFKLQDCKKEKTWEAGPMSGRGQGRDVSGCFPLPPPQGICCGLERLSHSRVLWCEGL